jgi:hypothetical protein
MAVSTFTWRVLGWPEHAHEKAQAIRREFHELEPDIEPGRVVGSEGFDPNDFGCIRGWFLIREEELQLEELADLD